MKNGKRKNKHYISDSVDLMSNSAIFAKWDALTM